MIKKLMNNRWAYFFLLPWIVLFLIFIFIPFVIGFLISLFEYDFSSMEFVLFDNYATLFKDGLFMHSIWVTMKLTLIVVPVTILFSLWVASIVQNAKNGYQSFIKASFYLPGVTSTVAIIVAWKWIFNPAYGLFAYLGSLSGIEPIDWYGKPLSAIILIAILLIVFFIGQPIILYSAAIGGIPETYYESANIDGAGAISKFIHITLPLLKPTTLFILVTMTIGSMQVFEVPMLLTSGGPGYETTTILYLLYKTAFEYTRFGLAASMGVVLFIIIGVIASIQFKILKSDVQY